MTPAKYRNDGRVSITAPGLPTTAPGEEKTPSDNKYLKDPAGLTLIQDREAPWETLHAGAPPASLASGLAKYRQIQIVNGSGELVTIVVNGDANRPKVILNDKIEIIEQDREIDSMTIEGNGAAGVYVYGMY